MAAIIQLLDITGISVSRIREGSTGKHVLSLFIADSSGDIMELELISEHASVLKTLNPNNQSSIIQR